MLTEKDGKYTIEVPKNSVLTFACVGYYATQATVTETTTLDILLVQNPDELNTIMTIAD